MPPPSPVNLDAPIDVLTAIDTLVERMINDAARGIAPLTAAGDGHASPALTFRPLDQHEHNKSLAVFLKVADLVHTNLATPSPRVMTRRDVYYQDPALFGTQRISDAAIELLASTLVVPRDALGIVAAPRGQAHEPCLARFASNVSLTALVHRGFATWHAGLLMTASGFPDLATRQFLAGLGRDVAHTQHVPVSVVADADPHGLHIALTYMTGRRVNGPRCVVEVGDVGKVVHVGVHLRDVELERTMQVRQFRGLLQAMLHINVKAEIQALDDVERYLETRLGLV
ncbi:hypothetical protein AMAG_11704 [Allomyces macrogynus ATCC 38327]|uniref:DNA topoisomerase (ATP-hydrolyzing) n=1 Tax=Allomyces macrogynus (strain ATCC 38327) TaxID=578462 RepID=A0A0L0SVN7_ALLM3|nr:hypothetical protein AMAG_11704 [Allomyces macrogynus ATCC 38327]|eukprot:KNE66577.1 hypothetical protein AMAG_11704 [Allomyces macrogynus ATCC 38327]